MPRTSKISKLPPALRDEVNERLERSDTAASIVEWLNALPEVQKILKASFKDEPVNEQNITNWRRSGFAAWQLRHDFMNQLLILSDEASDIAAADLDNLTAHASRLLAIRFALLLSPSVPLPPSNHPCPSASICAICGSSSSTPSFSGDLKTLCLLTRAVVALRRADTHAARVKLLTGKEEEPATLSDLMQEFAEIRTRKKIKPADPDPPAATIHSSPDPDSTSPAPPRSGTSALPHSTSNLNQVIPTYPDSTPAPPHSRGALLPFIPDPKTHATLTRYPQMAELLSTDPPATPKTPQKIAPEPDYVPAYYATLAARVRNAPKEPPPVTRAGY